MSEASRSLVRKLAEVMGEVDRVRKTGYNEHHRYKFAEESEILEAVRGSLARRALIIIPSVERTEVTPQGKGHLTTLHMAFTIEDGESGESRKLSWIGQGSDTQDKGAYKAMTGSEKYLLLKLFMIPTGDDPERDEKPAHQRRTAPLHEPTEGERVAAEPHVELDVTPEGDFGPVIPFGRNKGKRASQLNSKELDWYVERAQEDLENPDKARFKAKNAAYLQGLKDVLSSRKRADAQE